MGEYEIKKETEIEDTKTDTEEALEDAGEGLEDAGDKVKAGAKAFGKKVADPDKDLESDVPKRKDRRKNGLELVHSQFFMIISVNSKLIGAHPVKESTNQLPNNEFKIGKYSNRLKFI